jgi:hypothetical protein
VKNVTTYVGIDTHKKDLFIAMLVGTQTTPVTWTVPNEPSAIRPLVRKLEREAPGPIVACYEAGPCGYALQRQMTTPRLTCQVIAPALIPRKPGERVKPMRGMPASWPSCSGPACDRGAAGDARGGGGPRLVPSARRCA